MTEREAFEAQAELHGLETFVLGTTQTYAAQPTRVAWLLWQASRKQALEEIALPRSYGGSTLLSWGDQAKGCTVRMHFTDAAEAEAWFSRVGDQWDERRSLTPPGEAA